MHLDTYSGCNQILRYAQDDNFDRVFGMTWKYHQTKKHPRLSQGRGATLVNFKNRALTHDYENIPIL